MSYFFSIIIPVYNTEQYLPRALNSILKQTFDIKKIEVVVVNDGSPKIKQCDEVIEKYSSKLSIKYIRNEVNQGTHIARKLGIIGVTNNVKYLLYLDSDDYLSKKACEVLYNDIQKNGDADYIEFNYYSKYGIYKNYCFLENINGNIEDVLSKKRDHTIWNKCYKNSFIKNIYANMPDFYAYYSEDYYQMGIIEYYAKKKHFIKKPLYVYVLGIGITGEKKYKKEKLKKILLSIYNVELNLIDFYKKQNANIYIPLIHSFCENLYGNVIVNSSIEDFIEIAQEMFSTETIKNAFIQSILQYEDKIVFLEKRVKLLQPIKMLLKPFVFAYRYFKNAFKQTIAP